VSKIFIGIDSGNRSYCRPITDFITLRHPTFLEPCVVLRARVAYATDRTRLIFYFYTRITGQIKGLKCMVIMVRWFRKNWGCRSVMKLVIITSVVGCNVISVLAAFNGFSRGVTALAAI
jgi:hypothetical protein